MVALWETSVPEAHEAPVQEMLGVDGVSLGAASVKVDGVEPHPSDDTRGSLRDLVMCGASIDVPRSAALGNAALAPGPLGVVGLGVSALLLPTSPSFPPLPTDWRWVEDNAEFACPLVATVERLLHETLASVSQNILHPIWVSLKNERKTCLWASGFLQALSPPPAFLSAAPIPG
jgi:hypothetical protein